MSPPPKSAGFFWLALAGAAIAFFAAGLPAIAAPPDDDICPVHKTHMKPVELRLVYGMPSQKEFEEMKVAKKEFPFGRDYVLAGCVVKPPKTVSGYLCEGCVKAREAWLPTNR